MTFDVGMLALLRCDHHIGPRPLIIQASQGIGLLEDHFIPGTSDCCCTRLLPCQYGPRFDLRPVLHHLLGGSGRPSGIVGVVLSLGLLLVNPQLIHLSSPLQATACPTEQIVTRLQIITVLAHLHCRPRAQGSLSGSSSHQANFVSFAASSGDSEMRKVGFLGYQPLQPLMKPLRCQLFICSLIKGKTWRAWPSGQLPFEVSRFVRRPPL
jgi:hypothetical protein